MEKLITDSLQRFKNLQKHLSCSEIYKMLNRIDGHVLVGKKNYLSSNYLFIFIFFLRCQLIFRNFTQVISISKRNGTSTRSNFMKFLNATYQKIQVVIFQQNSNECQKNCQLIYALHANLYTPIVKTEGEASKNRRASLMDTLKYFILLCATENSMECNIEAYQQTLIQSGSTVQPFIVAFGESFLDAKEKFCVVVENLRYIFCGADSLILAINCLLKCFYVLNLQFPALNSNVYEFLCRKFLGIPNSIKKVKSINKVNILLNAFEN